MQRIEWSEEFEIGIHVIDEQHKRIVDYINALVDMGDNAETEEVARLIDSLVDYTHSHFAFEESLMEEAEYEFLSVHKGTHEAFGRRIKDLYAQFKDGKEVTRALGQLLQAWLTDHIRSDDQSYGPLVRQKFSQIENKANGRWIPNTIRRYFK